MPVPDWLILSFACVGFVSVGWLVAHGLAWLRQWSQGKQPNPESTIVELQAKLKAEETRSTWLERQLEDSQKTEKAIVERLLDEL